jgi:hypothetical protein
VTGGGTVARITFHALAPGQAAIRLAKATAKDSRLAAVAPVSARGATLRIRLVEPRPRPPGVGAVGAGGEV